MAQFRLRRETRDMPIRHALVVACVLALASACGCVTASHVVYEEGTPPRADEYLGMRFPYLLVTQTDIDRVAHLDAEHLVHDMGKLCRIHDQLMDAALAAEDPPMTRAEAIPIVHFPFKAQNVEVLRWALILRGDAALEVVVRRLRETGPDESSLRGALIQTLKKWRSEKATMALVEYGVELAARPDTARGPLHQVVAALFYDQCAGVGNLEAFLHSESVKKVRSIVVRLTSFEDASSVHLRSFNAMFPDYAVDPTDIDAEAPAQEPDA